MYAGKSCNDRARLIDLLAEAKKKGKYDVYVEAIRKALDGKLDPIDDGETLEELVGFELLHYDPIKTAIRFQTKLDERAAREILR